MNRISAVLCFQTGILSFHCCVICFLLLFVGISSAGSREADAPPDFVWTQNPAPQWTAEERARGFVVCSDHWMRPMYDCYIPLRDHIVSAFSCELARDTYEPVQVGVHAIDDLAQVKMKAKLDLPVTPYRMFTHQKEMHVSVPTAEGLRTVQRRTVNMPMFLYPEATYEKVPAGETRAFWIRIYAPKDARPGIHKGSVEITVAGRKAAVLPLQVTVQPFVLPRARVCFGLFADIFGRIAAQWQGPGYLRMYYADMLAHGMNNIILQNRRNTFFPEGAKVNEAALVERFALLMQCGLLDGSQPVVICGNSPALMEPEAAKRALAELERLREVHGWPEIMFYGRDEPHPPFEELKARLSRAKKAGCRLVSAMNDPAAVHALADVHAVTVVLASMLSPELVETVRKAGSTLWIYDCTTFSNNGVAPRAFAGLVTWESGAKGNLMWAYTHAHTRCYTIEGGQAHPRGGADWALVLPGPNGPLPSISWEARREGVDDYRYLQLLAELAQNPRADPRMVSNVNQWFRNLSERVKWHKMAEHEGQLWNRAREAGGKAFCFFNNPLPWITPEEYDKIIREAADLIVGFNETKE